MKKISAQITIRFSPAAQLQVKRILLSQDVNSVNAAVNLAVEQYLNCYDELYNLRDQLYKLTISYQALQATLLLARNRNDSSLYEFPSTSINIEGRE